MTDETLGEPKRKMEYNLFDLAKKTFARKIEASYTIGDYEELIAACDAALDWADANARWFDISTAPRDGTRVLVKGPWTDKDGEYITENYVWRGEKWTITYMTGYGEPTHWRPIQNPPLGQLPEPLERLGDVLRRVKNV